MKNWQSQITDIIALRVTPKAASNRIVAVRNSDGALLLRVYVTTVPEDGKANKAVLKLLAKELGVAKSALRIIRGEASRDKVVRVER